MIAKNVFLFLYHHEVVRYHSVSSKSSVVISDCWKAYNHSKTSSSYEHNFVKPEKGLHMLNTERRWREVQSTVSRYDNPKHHLHGHLAELFSYMMEQVLKKNMMKHLRTTAIHQWTSEYINSGITLITNTTHV